MSAIAIKLKEAKRQLYFLLLNRKEISDTEIDLLFYLSKDKQIQEIYKK